ncbi:type I-E CRISPR-associated protein Cas6/Cse3/CasE [Kallotenue papyrolyticum]|uniref:type I-E CRISPR-associated protein Cas6/Cse3/CasE n=1 Tax=Kallotenue papyrolyticum TaxID=1325125 RepID=UPI000472CF06|nr:type I-E CRISPR-associated protein Cas6/Cse3/CasE [Kallotenue papyrolyticum]
MLYLSRLLLNLRHRVVRHDLGDVHELHRTILRAFPPAPTPEAARQHFGVLFRLDPLPDRPFQARLLVQSRHAPDWSFLPDGYLAPASDERGNPAVREIAHEYARITPGSVLRFRLRANPTRRIRKNNLEQDEKWRGKRVDLRREADQIAWLQRKAEQGGFRLLTVSVASDVPDVRVMPQAGAYGYRRIGAERKRLTFGAVIFEGRLVVQDVERFRATLISGIGSGKAYGFGLLSVAGYPGAAA